MQTLLQQLILVAETTQYTEDDNVSVMWFVVRATCIQWCLLHTTRAFDVLLIKIHKTERIACVHKVPSKATERMQTQRFETGSIEQPLHTHPTASRVILTLPTILKSFHIASPPYSPNTS